MGICATGTYKGDIAGDSFFVGSSLIPTADTPTTGVVLLTGDNSIQTPEGKLMTKNAVALATSGLGELAQVDTIIGGTDGWAGYTGRFTAMGTFTMAEGGGGRYEGEACQPEESVPVLRNRP